MVIIPPKICSNVFNNEFKQSSVIKTKIRFSSGIEKEKYLVIVNKNPQNDPMLYFVATSKLDFYNKHPGYNKDIIRLPAGKIEVFPKETIIDCRSVEKGSRAIFESNFQRGTLVFAGELPGQIMSDIEKLVEQSFFIAKQDKEIILGVKESPECGVKEQK